MYAFWIEIMKIKQNKKVNMDCLMPILEGGGIFLRLGNEYMSERYTNAEASSEAITFEWLRCVLIPVVSNHVTDFQLRYFVNNLVSSKYSFVSYSLSK